VFRRRPTCSPTDSILDAVHKSYADLDLYVTVASNLRAMSDIIDFLVIAIDSEDDRTGAPSNGAPAHLSPNVNRSINRRRSRQRL